MTEHSENPKEEATCQEELSLELTEGEEKHLPEAIDENSQSISSESDSQSNSARIQSKKLSTEELEKKEKERIEFEKYRKRREALDNEFELRSLAKRRIGSHVSLIIGGVLFLLTFTAVLIFLNYISSQ